MGRKAIRLISAFSEQMIFIDRDEIRIVEGSKEHGAGAKVYCKTKGNFYVTDDPDKVARFAFDEVDVES